mmetsp:Transcript_24556/g.84746  ORF Transcript_24556/g.84746 Transcript_24556/m.84746 type:complete len:87 (-) Transcript_24556:39-299(-)
MRSNLKAGLRTLTVLSQSLYQSQSSKRSRRELRLQVAWSTVSSHQAVPFELKNGDVVQRDIAHVLQFETFRLPWHDEAKRRSGNAE